MGIFKFSRKKELNQLIAELSKQESEINREIADCEQKLFKTQNQAEQQAVYKRNNLLREELKKLALPQEPAKPSKPSKPKRPLRDVKLDDDELRDLIEDALYSLKKATISDIFEFLEDIDGIQNVPNQKMSMLLRQMVDEGYAKRDSSSNKTYFIYV